MTEQQTKIDWSKPLTMPNGRMARRIYVSDTRLQYRNLVAIAPDHENQKAECVAWVDDSGQIQGWTASVRNLAPAAEQDGQAEPASGEVKADAGDGWLIQGLLNNNHWIVRAVGDGVEYLTDKATVRGYAHLFPSRSAAESALAAYRKQQAEPASLAVREGDTSSNPDPAFPTEGLLLVTSDACADDPRLGAWSVVDEIDTGEFISSDGIIEKGFPGRCRTLKRVSFAPGFDWAGYVRRVRAERSASTDWHNVKLPSGKVVKAWNWSDMPGDSGCWIEADGKWWYVPATSDASGIREYGGPCSTPGPNQWAIPAAHLAAIDRLMSAASTDAAKEETGEAYTAETWPKGMVWVRFIKRPHERRMVWMVSDRGVNIAKSDTLTFENMVKYCEMSLDGGATWQKCCTR